MSEVTFAKSFLTTLDKRPIKLAADHVSDPRRIPNQSPYILPKRTHPFPRPTGPTSLQQAKTTTVTATLKPMRAGETITLSDITLDTTIHDLKSHYASKTNLAADKIKLLLNKKPTADLKTLKELGVESDVELSVMVMAGASTTAASIPRAETPVTDSPAAAPAPGAATAAKSEPPAPVHAPTVAAAAEMLSGVEFWEDLRGFMAQRLRDDEQAQQLAALFREAWEKRDSK